MLISLLIVTRLLSVPCREGLSLKDYDVFLHRCDKMNGLKFNVMKVPNHGSLSVCKLDSRLYSMTLFILLYDNGQGAWKKPQSIPVTRARVPSMVNI